MKKQGSNCLGKLRLESMNKILKIDVYLEDGIYYMSDIYFESESGWRGHVNVGSLDYYVTQEIVEDVIEDMGLVFIEGFSSV